MTVNNALVTYGAIHSAKAIPTAKNGRKLGGAAKNAAMRKAANAYLLNIAKANRS